MRFRIDNECCVQDGKTVGIYLEDIPYNTLHRTNVVEARKLTAYLNAHLNASDDETSAFLCDNCGNLMVALEYVEKSKKFLTVNSNLWQADWEEGRMVTWEYRCTMCDYPVPQEQLIEMGVIEA